MGVGVLVPPPPPGLEREMSKDGGTDNEKRKTPRNSDNMSTIDFEGAGRPGAARKYTLSVRKAAVIGDPILPKTWAERRIKNIFIYWMIMFLLAACINGTVLYAFVIIPDIYAKEELEKIFLFPDFYLTSIIGVEIVIVLTCFYAFYILVFPDESHWKIGNLRWFGFVILNGYIVYCLFCYGKDSTGMLSRLEKNMNKGLHANYSRISPRLEQSQLYFYCCGVRNHKSWEKYLPESQGYPLSCCDVQVYPVCKEPLKEKEGSVWVIHQMGCYKYEAILTLSITGIFFFFAGAFVISSIASTISMSMILSYVGGKDIKIEQANPFFD